MGKICVIGSLNMDLVINTPRIPVMGETIHGYGFLTAPGGKGANQAVAASRLGGDVTMIGCVGDDIFGKTLIDNLALNDVNVQHIKLLSGVPTGIAVITIKDGDNFIILDSGANYKLTPGDVEALENIICESSILLLQLEVPLQVVEKSIEIANKQGVKVLLNPAPAAKLSDELLSKIDIITPNESECEFITGIKINSIDDAKNAVGYLHDKGISQVIITMGEIGVVYNNENAILHKTAYRVNAVDTTAAGDSFSGALALAITEGKDIDEAVSFASAVGALTVTKKGAQPSLPNLMDVIEFLNLG